MFLKLVSILLSVYLVSLNSQAHVSLDSGQCDSNLIQYSWENKYGGIHRTNSVGKTLFKEATDFMIEAAESDDEDCAEAYLLVVEFILTSPNIDARKRGKNEDYLMEKIFINQRMEMPLLRELIENAPATNAMWSEYEQYRNNSDTLKVEYEQLAATIAENYCRNNYDYSRHGGGYDSYMKECASNWQ